MSDWDNVPGEMVACACGCGGEVRTPDVRGRPRTWIRGHHTNRASQAAAARRRTGFKHTPEARAKVSVAASRERPWLRGERNGMYGKNGPLNPRYVDGSSPERQRIYASSEWKALRRKVFARDGAKCADCGEIRDLHLHHVKPWAGHPELRLEPSNVVVLCREHHHDRHRKEVLL